MSRFRRISARIAARFAAKLAATVCMLGMLLVANGMASARPITPAEQRYWSYTGNMPACSHASVLRRIQSRFSQRERTYWHTGKEIVRFYRARQIGYRSNGLDLIPKRYCTIRARFNDGRKRQVSYVIGEGLGMAGFTWGVEWCVHGLDYNFGFAPNCKMARP